MFSMKKFSIALERYVETRSRSRVEFALGLLGRDLRQLAAESARYYGQPASPADDRARTRMVHSDCTVAAHFTEPAEIVPLGPVKPASPRRDEPATSSRLADDRQPPRSAA